MCVPGEKRADAPVRPIGSRAKAALSLIGHWHLCEPKQGLIATIHRALVDGCEIVDGPPRIIRLVSYQLNAAQLDVGHMIDGLEPTDTASSTVAVAW